MKRVEKKSFETTLLQKNIKGKTESRAEIVGERFRAIYEFATVGYFTINFEGVIRDLNFSGAKMLGAERSELLNKNFQLYITLDKLVVFEEFLQKTLETNCKQTCELEFSNEKKFSRFAYLEGIISDDDQNCLITAIDITDRKRAELELKDSEIRYRRLFESAKDGILILDADTGKIVDVNPFLYQMLGYDSDELMGKELWEIGVFNNIVDSKEAFAELQTKGYIRYEDLPLETKNGKAINVEFVSNVYFADRNKVIQCNIRDITERKLTEEKLKESENRLTELNSTKDKFFSIIAHDLKSPFNSIVGFSDLLKEKVQEKDYEGMEKYIEIIQNSSQNAMNLLMNLLEWSRLQTGRIKFSPEQIDLVSLVNVVNELLKDSALQKSITISCEFSGNDHVFADKDMISAILRNLISNAIKFTYPGGHIVISVEQSLNEIIVSVSDNGIGMRENAIKKLFLIEESHTTLGTQNEQGTGLGLLLCKEFIEKHDGEIWAESELGKGSKFSFKLPAKV